MTQPNLGNSIFTRGAVDLSGLGTPRPAPQASPQAGASAGGGVAVIDVTEATFQSEIIDRSMSTPVVVLFWVEGDPSSAELVPVLERLAAEGGGLWTLAKVDVDGGQRLAQAFGVRAVPTAIAIVGGQPVNAFEGPQPEPGLRQWIAELLNAAGVDAPQAEVPLDPRLVQAEDKLAEGDYDAAEAAYRKYLGENPGDSEAEAGLAQVGLLRRTEGADIEASLAAAEAAPGDLAAQTLAADLEVLTGEAAAAYARLIALVSRTSGAEREIVRKHLVELFGLAAPDDPAVAKARRQLMTVLF
ncbi:tetratricopeptide repeat protein [Phytomonospora sp. NPDC050363]|uniref:tetratricopeptide repeat protein n=1 Tax=Phytomonospora sp. NPDC050363 TaxID=3155642 RepID=UPI003411A015